MHSLSFWTRCLILMLLLTTGCSPKPSTQTTETTEDGVAVPAAEGGKSKKTLVPVKRNVTSLEGNWVVVVTTQRSDNYRWIIKFVKNNEGKVVAEFVDTSRDKEEQETPKILSSDIEGDSVRISFQRGDELFDFAGTFQQGFIRGTVRSSPKDVYLTRLLPTDESSLARFEATGLPPATDLFNSILKSKDVKPDDLLSAARENRTSPIAQDLFAMLMSGHHQANFDEAKVKELIDTYLSAANLWGDRWAARVEMSIAVNLINGRTFSSLAMPHLESAEAKFGDDRNAFTEMFTSFRDAANVNLRTLQLSSPSVSDEIKSDAFTQLTELLKKQRYNPEILFALATEAERTNQTDLAMQYLSDIVALPMLEAMVIRARAGQPPDTATPTESLRKLWAQKNKDNDSDDAFSAFVDNAYRTEIAKYIDEMKQQVPAKPESVPGNRTVLVELFTGMQCPPCVGADLALSAIGQSYPSSEVIVVRHHQHIPLPDGLVNQDSEERGAFYDTGATPTVVIDGMVVDARFYAGPIQVAGTAYKVFRQVIDSRVADKSDVKLELSAAVTNGQLEVSVAASGIPDDLLPSCRLRMAVVENEVRTIVPNGSNGIRDHEFLVREMLGGAKGIPPKKGELKYSITIPLDDIQQHVIDYIKQYEAGKRFEFPKQMKPPMQGPLSLVAWVQNDKIDSQLKSKLVLQSAMIPITGIQSAEKEAATPSGPAATPPVTPEPATKEPPATTPKESGEATSVEGPEMTPPAPALPE